MADPSQHRFFLLHGPDEFASAEYLSELKAGLSDPAMGDLNTSLFDGRGASLAEVRAIADTLPFLAARRLVIVEGWLTRLVGRAEAADKQAADKAPGDSQSDDEEPADEPLDEEARPAANASREQLAALAAYLPELPETTALILVEKRTIPAGNNAVLKVAAGADWALVKRFDLLNGEDLVRWIRKRAKAEGGEITLEAARALAEVEDDPRALGSEVAKLLAYASYARPVELEDVHTLTPAGGEAIIWNLVDAIGQRRGPVAQRELHKLLQTAPPPYIFTMIVRQYRLLLQVREMLDERAGESEIARALAMKPYPTGKFCNQARGFSLAGLESIYRRLLEYDVDIKTGRIGIEAALDTLVGALAAG